MSRHGRDNAPGAGSPEGAANRLRAFQQEQEPCRPGAQRGRRSGVETAPAAGLRRLLSSSGLELLPATGWERTQLPIHTAEASTWASGCCGGGRRRKERRKRKEAGDRRLCSCPAAVTCLSCTRSGRCRAGLSVSATQPPPSPLPIPPKPPSHTHSLQLLTRICPARDPAPAAALGATRQLPGVPTDNSSRAASAEPCQDCCIKSISFVTLYIWVHHYKKVPGTR